MTDVPFLQLGLEVGSGGVLGVLAGFAAKKLAKLVAVVTGAVLVLLAGLEAEGIIENVKWGALSDLIVSTEVGADAPQFLLNVAGTLPAGGGFVAGALVGFKKG